MEWGKPQSLKVAVRALICKSWILFRNLEKKVKKIAYKLLLNNYLGQL